MQYSGIQLYGAPSAPVKSPDQQPAAPAASDSPAAPDKPAAASAKPDSPATTKSTARPKPSKRAQRPAYPPRSPPRVRKKKHKTTSLSSSVQLYDNNNNKYDFMKIFNNNA
ncbi:unnamed protein product [Schistosoma margrebowiei]|uniref:Uncharacterized protein n=1 Tax=Schistosoma margrebowiei TaxID=48269 RepID=A0A183LI86_9TREM|nr:unnamed protein product [Schistosoma margrebowiei]